VSEKHNNRTSLCKLLRIKLENSWDLIDWWTHFWGNVLAGCWMSWEGQVSVTGLIDMV
jgi:hypothetical protein